MFHFFSFLLLIFLLNDIGLLFPGGGGGIFQGIGAGITLQKNAGRSLGSDCTSTKKYVVWEYLVRLLLHIASTAQQARYGHQALHIATRQDHVSLVHQLQHLETSFFPAGY